MHERYAIMVVLITVTIGVVTIIRALLDHVKRARTERVQADLYNRTLDKLGTGPEVMTYLQSEAGLRLFQSAPAEPSRPGRPYNRIINTVQLGVVVTVVSAGLLFLRNYLDSAAYGEREALLVFGFLGVFAGVALLLSAGTSWFLALRFGLMDDTSAREQ